MRVCVCVPAGMERFKSLTTTFYRGAAGALLVYDITSRPSFDNIKRWLKQLRQHALPEVVVLLVGNKSDLRRHRAVGVEEGLALAESCNMGFIETSALDSTGVENAFTTVVEGTCAWYAGYATVASLPAWIAGWPTSSLLPQRSSRFANELVHPSNRYAKGCGRHLQLGVARQQGRLGPGDHH